MIREWFLTLYNDHFNHFCLLSGFDNHLVLSGISENTKHVLAVERIIAKSVESYLSFSLRFRCEACTQRYEQQQQLREKDGIEDNVNLDDEDLSLPILFDDQSSSSPWEDAQEEEEEDNADDDCTCRLITPLQFKVSWTDRVFSSMMIFIVDNDWLFCVCI